MTNSQRTNFACNVAAGREAARTLRHFLAQHGLDEEILFACELSLTEACNNAVQHATPLQREQSISANVILTNSHVSLELTDHTDGFDWPGRVPPPEPETDSRRGLFLIQSLMDEVSYRRGKGENVLSMLKRRT